jgi:hypothetical protein
VRSVKWKHWTGVLVIYDVSSHRIALYFLGPCVLKCARGLGTTPVRASPACAINVLVRPVSCNNPAQHAADVVFLSWEWPSNRPAEYPQPRWLLIVESTLRRQDLRSAILADCFRNHSGPTSPSGRSRTSRRGFQKPSLKNRSVAILFLFCLWQVQPVVQGAVIISRYGAGSAESSALLILFSLFFYD